MKINLITTKADIKDVYVRGGHILECFEKEAFGRTTFRYAFLDPATGLSNEISPEIGNYSLIPVRNCIWQSEAAYFASYRVQDTGKALITIFRHDSKTKETKEIFSYEEDVPENSESRKTSVFIFQGSLILIQNEDLFFPDDSSAAQVSFSQVLINCENGTRIRIKDKNLIKNGINTIIPVSKTHILLKTGFSHPEDERFRNIPEEGALIESVYYGITSSFLSSSQLENATEGFKMISTAYNKRNILMPHTAGDYIHFTIVEPEKGTGETIFYNFKTDNTLTCQDLSLDPDDMRIAYVINNVPYIRQSHGNQVDFINLLTSDTECVFYDERFAAALGDLLMFSKVRREKTFLRGYRLPNLELVFETRGTFAAGCRDNEKYYIYVNIKNN